MPVTKAQSEAHARLDPRSELLGDRQMEGNEEAVIVLPSKIMERALIEKDPVLRGIKVQFAESVEDKVYIKV